MPNVLPASRRQIGTRPCQLKPISAGKMREAKIIGMLVTRESIQMQVYISGELKLMAGNL